MRTELTKMNYTSFERYKCQLSFALSTMSKYCKVARDLGWSLTLVLLQKRLRDRQTSEVTLMIFASFHPLTKAIIGIKFRQNIFTRSNFIQGLLFFNIIDNNGLGQWMKWPKNYECYLIRLHVTEPFLKKDQYQTST